MTAQRVDQFTERERKRIASDLHDDLGAKLLTIVHTADATRVPQLAREALEEMRLSVRGLTGRPVRLDDALADWRAEIVGRAWARPRSRSSGTSPAEHSDMLPARLFVQLTRVLREAVSNVIKHSGAIALRGALHDRGAQPRPDRPRRRQGHRSSSTASWTAARACRA